MPEFDSLGINYTRLRDVLRQAAQTDQSDLLWQAADLETYEVMIRVLGKIGRKSEDWFTSEELLNFPCADLKKIDALWVHYSQGRFGFSVQKQIYVACGAKLDGKYPGEEIWEEFGDRVGWRKNGKWLKTYTDLEPSLSYPQGIFPFWALLCFGMGWVEWGMGMGRLFDLFSRAETCKL